MTSMNLLQSVSEMMHSFNIHSTNEGMNLVGDRIFNHVVIEEQIIFPFARSWNFNKASPTRTS